MTDQKQAPDTSPSPAQQQPPAPPPAPPAATEALPWGKLECTVEGIPDIELRGEEPTRVGRADASQGLGKNTAISNRHCQVWRERAGHTYMYFVEDSSTNGTFVNGARIRKGVRQALQSGVDIALLDPKKVANSVTYRFVELESERREREQGGPQDAYEMGRVLGKGHFATVRRVRCRADGREYAMKIIEKAKSTTSSKRPGASLKDEARILMSVHHRNVIAVKEIYETQRFFYIVLELATGGELFDRIVASRKFSEPVARGVVAQMLDALAYLHARGIAHRDLKPENVLLEAPGADTIKITDFGLSRMIDEGSFMRTTCGTPAYVAPEVLQGRREGYTAAVDLWSLGVMTYVMLCGFQPFNSSDNNVLFRQIKAGSYDFPLPYWAQVSDDAKDFVSKLLTVDPAARLTAEQAMEHPWIKAAGESSEAAAEAASAGGAADEIPETQTQASAPEPSAPQKVEQQVDKPDGHERRPPGGAAVSDVAESSKKQESDEKEKQQPQQPTSAPTTPSRRAAETNGEPPNKRPRISP